MEVSPQPSTLSVDKRRCRGWKGPFLKISKLAGFNANIVQLFKVDGEIKVLSYLILSGTMAWPNLKAAAPKALVMAAETEEL